LGNKKCE